MDNNCLLLGNELAMFIGKVANMKFVSRENASENERVILDDDNIARKVAYVVIKSKYSKNETSYSCDRVFYVLDGSGRFVYDGDSFRYIAGDIIPIPAKSEFSFISDEMGTKLIEVCSEEKSKPEENVGLENI